MRAMGPVTMCNPRKGDLMPAASTSQAVPRVSSEMAAVFEGVAGSLKLYRRFTQHELLKKCTTDEHVVQLLVWLCEHVQIKFVITDIKLVDRNLALRLARSQMGTA